MEERLKIFIAEIDAQWREILRLHSSVQDKSAALAANRDNEDLTNSLAYKIHNLYSAYEDLFKLTAGFFENQINDASMYHSGLINRMRLDIEGIRPRLLSGNSFRILDELRGFRHVFRHAYSYEIDAERLLPLSKKADMLKEVFSGDLEAFKKTIMTCRGE